MLLIDHSRLALARWGGANALLIIPNWPLPGWAQGHTTGLVLPLVLPAVPPRGQKRHVPYLPNLEVRAGVGWVPYLEEAQQIPYLPNLGSWQGDRQVPYLPDWRVGTPTPNPPPTPPPMNRITYRSANMTFLLHRTWSVKIHNPFSS